MSALLAALQRLEGRAPATANTAAPTFAPAPAIDSIPAFFPEPLFAPPNMSPLAEPLRSEGWDEISLPANFDEPQAEAEVPPPIVESVEAVETVATDDGAAALMHMLHAPALAAVVSVEVSGDLLPLLRGFGEALSARSSSDVVLLGPGMLDDAVGLAAQWKVLCSHVGYGLVHATADRATSRLDALRQTAGVIAVVELGRTTVQAVQQLRTHLTDRGIQLLGTLAVRDE